MRRLISVLLCCTTPSTTAISRYTTRPHKPGVMAYGFISDACVWYLPGHSSVSSTLCTFVYHSQGKISLAVLGKVFSLHRHRVAHLVCDSKCLEESYICLGARLHGRFVRLGKRAPDLGAVHLCLVLINNAAAAMCG